MNDALLQDLTDLGLDDRSQGRRITQTDIARAFGGDAPSLSDAVQGLESSRGAKMLRALDRAARALRGAVDAREQAARPFVWNRAVAGLRQMERLLAADDPRAETMRGLL